MRNTGGASAVGAPGDTDPALGGATMKSVLKVAAATTLTLAHSP